VTYGIVAWMAEVDLSIVLPAYNEGQHIEQVVDALAGALASTTISTEIIVVNNGSRDNTAAVLAAMTGTRSTLRVVSLAENQGYGGGILSGLAVAEGKVLGWTDADGQIEPMGIVYVYNALVNANATVAKAVRRTRNESLFRRVQSRVFNMLFHALFGGNVTDINAKPKLMVRSAYQALHLTSTDFFIDAELMIKAVQRRLPVAEATIEWHRRAGGKSHIRLNAALEFFLNMLKYRFSN
jgi:glycosyltransferase involved in cell wall biosynthesis